jgi:hypothetical protein
MFSFLTLHNYFEVFALLTSLFFWRYIKQTPLRWLAFFLFFIVLVEITGKYYKVVLHQSNAWLYNFSVPIEYLFYGWLLSQYFRSKIFIKIAQVFLVCFFVFAGLQLFVFGGLTTFNTIFFKIGSLAMIVFCCFYFIDFMREEVPLNPVKEPMFWIASGLFLFNAGEFLYVSLSNVVFSDWKKWKPVISQINNKLVVLLYATISIGIITLARKQWIQKSNNY